HDWIVMTRLFAFAFGTIAAIVVIGRVGCQARNIGFDQGWTVAGAGTVCGLAYGAVHGERIRAVNRDAAHAVADGSIRDAADRHLLRRRHADRVVVVLAHEDRRQLVDRGEVQAFVKVAFRRGAIAEIDDADAAVASDLARQRGAGGVWDLG